MVLDAHKHERVLILPPTAKDGEVTCALLLKAGVDCVVSTSVQALANELVAGAAVVVLTEEALFATDIGALIRVLDEQPSWSELPVIMLMRGGVESSAATEALQSMSNVLLLERPATMRALVSAVKAAQRARMRQYQIRDQLAEIERNSVKLAAAADERKALLESEREARREAERASRMKDDFVATVSHELRTPMSAVLGWSQMLRNGACDQPSIARGLEVIERNAKLQSQLIEDLLDMSRIISGKIRLDIKAVDIAQIVVSAVESIRHSAEAKGITLQTKIESSCTLHCDADRIQQVLWNLLSNSVKFTPRNGEVSLIARNGGSQVQLIVKDTGVGIKPEFLPYVFERFRQSDPSTTRQFGGLGLGLNIVKHLVELHGGSVSATSDGDGKGATFCVNIPTQPPVSKRHQGSRPAQDDAKQVAPADLKGLHVLVIDDDADGLEFVGRVLTENGAFVRTSSSARRALEMVSQNRFDVLVSDIGMPEMDGYEFVRELRSRHFDSRQLPAIALTAYAGEQHQDRVLQAGYQAHITKPFDVSALITVICDLAHRHGMHNSLPQEAANE